MPELKDLQLEQKLQRQELKINELSLETDTLEKEFDELLNYLKMTREQLRQFISNQENFTDENWKEIKKQQCDLDRKLLLHLKNISNPQSVKKAYEERSTIAPHWLFVR